MARRGRSNKRGADKDDSEYEPKERPAKKQLIDLTATSPEPQFAEPQITRTSSKGNEPPVSTFSKSESIDLSGEKSEQKSSQYKLRPLVKADDKFLRWRDGEVYIELRHGGKKRAYQLNQSVLERASSWFFDALRQPPPAELDYELAASGTRKTNVTTRFELVYDSELDSEILRRMPLTTLDAPQNPVPAEPYRTVIPKESVPSLIQANPELESPSTESRSWKDEFTSQNHSLDFSQLDGVNENGFTGENGDNTKVMSHLTFKRHGMLDPWDSFAGNPARKAAGFEQLGENKGQEKDGFPSTSPLSDRRGRAGKIEAGEEDLNKDASFWPAEMQPGVASSKVPSQTRIQGEEDAVINTSNSPSTIQEEDEAVTNTLIGSVIEDQKQAIINADRSKAEISVESNRATREPIWKGELEETIVQHLQRSEVENANSQNTTLQEGSEELIVAEEWGHEVYGVSEEPIRVPYPVAEGELGVPTIKPEQDGSAMVDLYVKLTARPHSSGLSSKSTPTPLVEIPGTKERPEIATTELETLTPRVLAIETNGTGVSTSLEQNEGIAEAAEQSTKKVQDDDCNPISRGIYFDSIKHSENSSTKKHHQETSTLKEIFNKKVPGKPAPSYQTENSATRPTVGGPSSPGRSGASSVPYDEVDKASQETPPGQNPHLLGAYSNLFLIYYYQSPVININDIETALEQMETLVQVAITYGSVPLIRPYMNNCIFQFGHDIYKAVLEDPPRWLRLSIYLESAPIFKEAVIHVVGSWPNWRSSTVEQRELPPFVYRLCGKKLEELEHMKKDIDEKLLCQTIIINNNKFLLNISDKVTFDTWFVVQQWREWFVRKLSEAKGNQIDKDAYTEVYRTMARGGETYLPLASVIELLEAFRWGKSTEMLDKASVEEDLKMLKDYAQATVRPLCENYSLLPVEEACFGHFTCTKVENSELPWLNGDIDIES